MPHGALCHSLQGTSLEVCKITHLKGLMFPASPTPSPFPTVVTYCEFFAFSKRPPAPHALLLEDGDLALFTRVFKLAEITGFGRLGCPGEAIEVHFQGACEEMPKAVMEGLLKSSPLLVTHYSPTQSFTHHASIDPFIHSSSITHSSTDPFIHPSLVIHQHHIGSLAGTGDTNVAKTYLVP